MGMGVVSMGLDPYLTSVDSSDGSGHAVGARSAVFPALLGWNGS
jgi:hypothetical protein